MGRYRRNVAALLVNEEDRLLIAERLRYRDAWQFPQGGVDRNETEEEALYRELEEELGLAPAMVKVIEWRSGYRYEFPPEMRRFGRNIGQNQTYFLCRFLGRDHQIRLDNKVPEFRSFRWIKPEEFDLNWLPEFKRDVYRRVLWDFFGVGGERGAL